MKMILFTKSPNHSIIQSPNLEKSYEICKKITLGHYENFPVASLLVPKHSVEEISETFEHNNLMNILKRSNSFAIENCKYIDKGRNNLHMVCVASGWGIPALADFESKIVEGGICTIETSESKNFTHGRYINTFYNKQNRAMVIFESPEDKELSKQADKAEN